MLCHLHIRRCWWRFLPYKNESSGVLIHREAPGCFRSHLLGEYRNISSAAKRPASVNGHRRTIERNLSTQSQRSPVTQGSSCPTEDNSERWSAYEEHIARCASEAAIEYVRRHKLGPHCAPGGGSRWTPVALVLLVVCAGVATVVYVESVRSSLLDATGNAAGVLLHNRAFHDQSMSFLRRLAEDFLNSAETEELLKCKVEQLLLSSGEVLRNTVVDILQQDEVTKTAYSFSRQITEDLCKDGEVIEYVGQLLLDAINTKTAVDGAAKWFSDIAAREDTVETIERLLCERVLSNATVHAEALNLCKSVTSQFLSAESTKRESVAFIKSVLDRPSLHAHLSQALIEVLKQSFYPRWFVGQGNFQLKRFDASVDGDGVQSPKESVPRFI
ncbi:hypothetical protein BBBOND_0109460 [Babesia bigemina]|uniref:Uncharacterized protein n=1 Tax=Babesia bigemina TaxID=5866 RepID=A0A061D1Z0_BABBI|nr:hypothetical protein BBBOND_0109460 [Babesia bigemina]CDR94648.1 hypothetical protein BBBOND_0109460 [Babesia bigemina]|eukprot:XP_012766834.1 hypothetical protein BBBOND_0109460 [Babesia bigemina]